MARQYRMSRRAETRDRTRERIVRATMAVHDEKGVAPATFSEIAARAGVGTATVLRHFPTLGDLVQACGVHVWQEMQPPVPDAAPAVFAGLTTTRQRLTRLVEVVDAFYARGALRLRLAARDRELVPELDGFLRAVEAGVAALVAEALRGEKLPSQAAEVAAALMSFPVWDAFRRAELPAAEATRVRVRLLECGLRAAADAG